MADRGEMPLLALGLAMRRGGTVSGTRNVEAGRFRTEQVQPRLQQMGHRETGAVGDRRLGGGQWIAAVEAEQPDRPLIVIARTGGGAAQGMAMLVDLGHRKEFVGCSVELLTFSRN